MGNLRNISFWKKASHSSIQESIFGFLFQNNGEVFNFTPFFFI